VKFTEKYRSLLTGVIKGFDRIRFRGTLRRLTCAESLGKYLSMRGILLKDFKEYALGQTASLVSRIGARAQELGVPSLYLPGPADKEALARERLALLPDGHTGPLCVLTAAGQCFSPGVVPSREAGTIGLRVTRRKCRHMYFYFQHPQYGFGHVRLQTWLPFQVSVNLNGRHWLERQMIGEGIGYRKAGNCFTWLADAAAAQELLDRQPRSDWPGLLGGLLRDFLGDAPGLPDLLDPGGYYWSADETEFATDHMFRDAASLDRLFPAIVRHAMLVSDSPAVLRYLGRSPAARGGPAPGEVSSDVRRRAEGVRVKHRAGANSVKAYNKQGNILRVETTVNDPSRFKSFRSPGDDGSLPKKWLPMRKGIADLMRRCEVSDACNERYAEALAGAPEGRRFAEEAGAVSRPVRKGGRRFRALRLWGESDQKLMAFIGRGEHAVCGFRNRDLALFLADGGLPADAAGRRRLAARAGRLIRLLREHGLVRKVPRENRYLVQPKGLSLAQAVLCVNNLEISRIAEMAA
jgi:hypothetical protein